MYMCHGCVYIHVSSADVMSITIPSLLGRALQTKVLHLEKDKRELEQSLQMLRRSQERVEAENLTSRQKQTEQLHSYRKEVAQLKAVSDV